MKTSGKSRRLPTIGWREWASLPDLKIPAVQMKVDTGAKTSVLHAEDIHVFEKGRNKWVEFSVYPRQGYSEPKIRCQAPVFDQRIVSDSGGHRELRYVIQTTLRVGSVLHTIDVTLTNRSKMKFRMLLGRSAIRGHFIVDVSQYCILGSLKNIKK